LGKGGRSGRPPKKRPLVRGDDPAVPVKKRGVIDIEVLLAGGKVIDAHSTGENRWGGELNQEISDCPS